MSLMLSVCFLQLNAQFWEEDIPKPKKNSIYLEGLGNGIFYSVNYDHLFSLKKNPKIGFGARIGISYGTYYWFWGFTPLTTLPVEAYYSYGTKSCLELGLGYTSLFEEDYYDGAITLRASYKYRGPKGVIFGVGLLAFGDSYGIAFPLPHLSIGFSF
jgi:hypothetical protein